MKVPIYQNQVSLPKTSGVGQLSVQANPQAMSAGSRAQAQFGQTLVAGGINWYEDFVKLDQAQEQATETSKFDKFISNATTANLRTHPSDWKNKKKLDAKGNPTLYNYFEYSEVIRKSLELNAKAALNKIKSKAVRTRMASVFAQRINSALVTMNATNRGKYVDFSKNVLKTTMGEEHKRIAEMAPGPDKEQAIKDALGTFRLFKSKRPLMGDAYFGGQERDFLSTIGALGISSMMDGIDTAADAKLLIRKLDQPKKGDDTFADVQRIDAETKQKFIDRLSRLRTSLTNKEAKETVTKIQRENVIKKKTRDDTADNLTQKITAIRDAVANNLTKDSPGWPKGKDNRPLVMPTVSEIARNKNLDPEDSKRIIEEINGEDQIFNPAEFRYLQDEIEESVTDDDLNRIEQDIRSKKRKGYIGGKAYDLLRKDITAARKKNPEFLERKRYRTLLKDAMNKANVDTSAANPNVGYTGRTGQQKVKAKFGVFGVGAMNFFDEQIAEGKQPSEAFWTTVTKFHQDKLTMIKSTLTSMDSVFPESVIKDPQKFLTPYYIRAAKESLRNALLNSGVLTKIEVDADPDEPLPTPRVMSEMQKDRGEDKLPLAQRMTIRRLFDEEQKIKFLEDYANIPVDERGLPNQIPRGSMDTSVNETTLTDRYNKTEAWVKGVWKAVTEGPQ